MICSGISLANVTAARHLLGGLTRNRSMNQRYRRRLNILLPQDARFATQQNLDEAVQRLMGKRPWGTLQALRINGTAFGGVKFIAKATSAPQRQARLRALREEQLLQAACAICYRCLMTRGYRLKP